MSHIKKIDEMKINESWLGDNELKILNFASHDVEHLGYTILWLITQEDYTLPKDLVERILKYENTEFTTNDRLRVWRCL